MTEEQRRGFIRLREIANLYGHRGAELMIEQLSDGLEDMGYDTDEGVIFEAAGLARQETWDGAVARLVLILHEERPFPEA